jgi:transcriptional regulator with XRE-family HTH domain
MRILNLLRHALEERGLTQLELSELAEVNYAVIQRAVREDADPFLDDVLRIAAALGVPVERLFRLATHGEHPE